MLFAPTPQQNTYPCATYMPELPTTIQKTLRRRQRGPAARDNNRNLFSHKRMKHQQEVQQFGFFATQSCASVVATPLQQTRPQASTQSAITDGAKQSTLQALPTPSAQLAATIANTTFTQTQLAAQLSHITILPRRRPTTTKPDKFL